MVSEKNAVQLYVDYVIQKMRRMTHQRVELHAGPQRPQPDPLVVAVESLRQVPDIASHVIAWHCKLDKYQHLVDDQIKTRK